ncbi:MAG: hypothetical protein GF346_13750 [Candidatus Eisenbacteria bacterium]|nr:hypothetical protein [Candidatus Latescibacterota bacterium]MBD3303505.1 hypothetical protein [Candidatus Eisenbacteria bacterium]
MRRSCAGSPRRSSGRVTPEGRERERLLRSRRNPRVVEARRLARDPREARREGLFLADGTRPVLEALDAGLSPRVLFYHPESPEAGAIQALCRAAGFAPTAAATGILSAVSTLSTPQDAVGLFRRPVHDLAAVLAAPAHETIPCLFVLDRLQDPTNAGALCRSGLAAGMTGALATEGTVDPFHPRAVRAAMGASFRLPIVADLPVSVLGEALERGGYRLLGLDPRGSIPLAEVRLDRPTALLLGSEGSGPGGALRSRCEATVRIPMQAGVDSLGVAAAGAVVFYFLRLRDRLFG